MQLLGERWKARCSAGAGVGDRLVIEAVDQKLATLKQMLEAARP